MATYTQLLLFEEPMEVTLMREFKCLKKSVDNIRKGQFARLGELKKMIVDVDHRLQIIESNICKMMPIQTQKCEILELATN